MSEESDKRRSLRDADITSMRAIDRRTALALAGGAAASIAVATASPAQRACSDNDAGPGADPEGRGRISNPCQTDKDAGPNADVTRLPPNRGRSISDGDEGPKSDPPGRGHGRRYTGRNDEDLDVNGDPPGYGR
jgi:hypothetical protein